jgi:hypothetical protein
MLDSIKEDEFSGAQSKLGQEELYALSLTGISHTLDFVLLL